MGFGIKVMYKTHKSQNKMRHVLAFSILWNVYVHSELFLESLAEFSNKVMHEFSTWEDF